MCIRYRNKGAKYPKPGGIQSGDNPKYLSLIHIEMCIRDRSYTLLMSLYSCNNTPYASLGGVMSGDIKERTSITSIRFVAVSYTHLMLLYNPFYLFDTGFQLSFLAVFSILFIYPVIFRCWRVHHPVPVSYTHLDVYKRQL